MSDAGQALGTVVGGVIGFIIGGPGGAVRGAALGYVLTGSRDGSSSSPTYSFGSTYNTRSHELPIPVIYGRNRVAGNTIFERISGSNNDKIALQIGISEGPIQSITEIKANDVDITSKCRVKLGARTQTPDPINDLGQTFPYLAYISTELTADENLRGAPAITSIVEGRLVKVWRDGEWIEEYSNNPAWCIYDFLTNTRYGLGIDERYIDLDSFISVAAACDQLVPDGQGGQEKRFQLDYVLDAKKSSLDYLREMLATFGAYLIYSQGELRLKLDGPEDPVQHFDMDNIIADSFSYSKASRKEIYNRVRVQYIDPNEHWEKIYAQYSLDSDIRKRGPVALEIPLLGITRFSQAGRMARFYQKKSWFCNTFCQFNVGIGALECEVGDVITVTHDVPGWVKKEFRILEIHEYENDEMTLICQEYNVAVYSDEGVVYQRKRDSELPSPFLPPDPSELILEESTFLNKSGEVINELRITFTPAIAGYPFYSHSILQISADGGTTWMDVGTIFGSGTMVHGVRVGQTYVVRARTVSTTGAMSPGLIKQITIVGKNQPPNNVKGFTVIQQEGTLKVTVVPPPDPDINRYELRVGGVSWETSSYVKQFKDNQTTVDVTQAGVQTFWLKTIDNSGNYAAEAVSFIAEIHPVSNKYTIHEEQQNGQSWQPSCMFRDKGTWQIDSIEKIDDLEFFADIFEGGHTLCDDAEIVLNPVDLGDMVNGNYVETFLSVFVDYDASDKNYIEIDYRTSYDGDTWSDWLPLINHQFSGRFVQPKIKPRSVDGLTNVGVRGATLRIDVTATTETIDFIDVPAEGTTRVTLKHRFFNTPMPYLFSYTLTGKQCTHEIVGNVISRDENGQWYFDVRLWDGETQIAGRIGGTANGY